MESFSKFIVYHKKTILFIYIVLIGFSFIGSQLVDINYDLSSYLPGQLNSIKGREILQEEFGISGLGYLLVRDKSFLELEELVEGLRSIEGVKDLVWLGAAEDIFIPEEFMDERVKDEFLRDGANLLQIQFVGADDSMATVDSMEKVLDYIGDEGIIGGPAAISHDMQKITSKEMIYYSIIAFIIIFIILFLSMESFVEPILFFISIGVAIILNKGTNIIFPSVSFNTDSVASIIQLAVSMDYSIFLIHRYIEEKKYFGDKDKAMISAIGNTFISVLSSSLTTVGGFLALTFMKYGIGKDIGLVLAKGVLFSLVSVVTLLPVLVLMSDRLIEKYQHRIFLPSFRRSSSIIVKYGHLFLIVALVLSLPSFLGQSQVNYYYSNERVLPKTFRSNIGNREIDRLFQNKNQLAALVPKGDKVREFNMIEELRDIGGVTDVKGLYSLLDLEMAEEFIPEDILGNFQGENFSLININLGLAMEGEEVKEAIEGIREKLGESYDEWYLTGESVIYADLAEVTSKDYKNITLISIAVIGSILILAFKSIVIPIILVALIQVGIWINLAIPYVQGIDLNFISFIIIGAIQLGATVDYAILYTSRYQENIKGLDKREAAIKTIVDTGRPILTSALILFTATLSVYAVTSMRNTAELTLLIGRGAIISLILVLVVLPPLLIIFYNSVKKTIAPKE
ncbi:MAG: MMPL family transporter [Tissierellaceae bacterium]